jgi:hypothetical protein
MPASSTPDAATTAQRLDHVATSLDLLLADLGTGFSVGIARDGEDLELHVRPLVEHPVSELLGFTAPDSWWAFGVATTGRAHPVAEEGRAAEVTRAAEVRLVHLVARDGTTHSTVTHDDGRQLLQGGDTSQGLIDDICKRALGLPTSLPRTEVIELFARMWLFDVLGCLEPPTCPTWAAIASLHPAVGVVRATDPSLAALAADRLITSGRLLAQGNPWPQLRASCVSGQQPIDGVTADEAAWLDDGSFSRLVESMWPDLTDLVDALSTMLPTRLMREVDETLAAWDLEPRPG